MWRGRNEEQEEEAAPIKRRHIISVHMHEVDRSIHPPISQSKAIDDRAQPGDRGSRLGQQGEDEHLIEQKKRKGKSCLEYVIGRVACRCVSREKSRLSSVGSGERGRRRLASSPSLYAFYRGKVESL